MKIFLIVIMIMIGLHAENIVTLDDGSKIILKDNGKWESYNKKKKNNSNNSYMDMDYIGVSIQRKELVGKNITVQGYGSYHGRTMSFYRKDLSKSMNVNIMAESFFLDLSKLSRKERNYIVNNCTENRCFIRIYGRVLNPSPSYLQIITDKIRW